MKKLIRIFLFLILAHLSSQEDIDLNRPRNLLYEVQAYHPHVQAFEILINDNGIWRNISWKETFLPGTEHEFLIRFKRYRTVRTKVKIESGTGPQVIPTVPVTLSELFRREFTAPKNRAVLDGIVYSYIFYADQEQIEDHLILEEKGIGRFYYTVWIEPEAKILRAELGYLFTEVPVDRLQMGLGRLEKISISNLIKHLEQLAKNNSKIAALESIEKMLGIPDNQSKLRQCSLELDRLIVYIQEWQFDGEVQPRVEKILATIAGLKE